MQSARAWKEFYAAERQRLGPEGLGACLDRAEAFGDLPVRGGALVFPHTRLEASGELPAAVALAAVRAGCEEVLALGVLHGAREQDATLVQRARQGDAAARGLLRGVHGPGVPGDAGRWQEEFSLDNFCALVELAARRANRPPPRVIGRFPFLVGANPGDLPGLEELAALVARGAMVVVTADPMHHGVGYGTPAVECRRLEDSRTWESARADVAHGFSLLARRDYAGFLEAAAVARSDFRDAGPMLAHLLPGEALGVEVRALRLVDYAEALGAAEPTWVAGALGEFSCVVGVGRD